jgi:hypothetical protein
MIINAVEVFRTGFPTAGNSSPVERLGQPCALDLQDVDGDARIDLRAGRLHSGSPRKFARFNYCVLPIG